MGGLLSSLKTGTRGVENTIKDIAVGVPGEPVSETVLEQTVPVIVPEPVLEQTVPVVVLQTVLEQTVPVIVPEVVPEQTVPEVVPEQTVPVSDTPDPTVELVVNTTQSVSCPPPNCPCPCPCPCPPPDCPCPSPTVSHMDVEDTTDTVITPVPEVVQEVVQEVV